MKLAQLKLTNTKKPIQSTDEQQRRSKMLRRLQEQMELARAQLNNTTYAPERQRTIKDSETGLRRVVSTNKRVKCWWFGAEGGRLALTVRYGSQILELAKGKYSIDVSDTAQLLPTLELVMDVVKTGELDTQIAVAASTLRKGFKK